MGSTARKRRLHVTSAALLVVMLGAGVVVAAGAGASSVRESRMWRTYLQQWRRSHDAVTTTTSSTTTSSTTSTTASSTTTTTTVDPPPPPSTGAPSSPPVTVCGNASQLTGPSTPPAGAVVVPAGDNSATVGTNWTMAPNTTYWFAPGVHTLGSNQFSQIIPQNGDVFIGGPGAVIDGQNLNNYAFTGQATNVTVEYLEVRHFTSPDDQGVVNHDFGAGWTIEHNYAHDNSGGAIFVGTNNVAEYNCMANNGQYGFQGAGTNLTLSYNEIAGNDTANIQGCGCQGGGKFWDASNATVTYNYVHNNSSVGLWADTNNRVFDIEHNYIADNADEAIIYETSYNFKIDNNTFVRNEWAGGYSNGGFANPAVYISESGGDARVSATYAQSSVSNNNFVDNWGGVTLYENADRYCTSGANTSTGYCTLDNSLWSDFSTPTQCEMPTVGTSPYISDCRWKTQNVTVSGNHFSLNAANVPHCTTANLCGENGLFSMYGTVAPFVGTAVEDHIAYGQNNHFSNNTYTGPWQFMAHDQGNVVSFAQWQAAPYGQDGSSSNTP